MKSKLTPASAHTATKDIMMTIMIMMNNDDDDNDDGDDDDDHDEKEENLHLFIQRSKLAQLHHLLAQSRTTPVDSDFPRNLSSYISDPQISPFLYLTSFLLLEAGQKQVQRFAE